MSDPCVNCGGDGFLYDDRGVPSICGSCGGSGVSRFCPVEPRCDHPGPRCVDCARMGCIQRCRPYEPCGNTLVYGSPKRGRTVRAEKIPGQDDIPYIDYPEVEKKEEK